MSGENRRSNVTMMVETQAAMAGDEVIEVQKGGQQRYYVR